MKFFLIACFHKTKTLLMRIVLLLLLLCSQECFPQTSADSLKTLSIQWMKALERKDASALENFLAKEFTLSTVGEAEFVDRSTWMKNAIEKTWGNTSYKFKSVRIEGNQAIVNSVMSFTVKPIPFLLKSDVLDHWSYRDGRWQVVTRYLGANSITNFFKVLKGYAIGVLMVLIVLWLRRFGKKSTAVKS